MSQYDNYKTVTYKFTGVDFTSSPALKLPIPRGAKFARVLDVMLAATTTFTQVTTPAQLKVGDGTTADKFAAIVVGALASGSTLTGNDVQQVWNANYLAGNYNSGAGLHDLVATPVAPTGGTPAGVADVYVLVGYDQIEA